ncbi:cupin domain-containing protein [Arthrobacter sp. NicSoilB8]|uniref:cupin domain-containing protein n=1 Tax=Arthrobacter sp. NicSoilB8 TaxID=2830998 RepID=UPI001CC6E580|nr:cupin domain-containing protein [Arthrobacter sp. NicSoilB8]BCW69934.1 hypothetical protein NicSoilB8_09780 [Arthrobacter sp. NicSoilB8]
MLFVVARPRRRPRAWDRKVPAQLGDERGNHDVGSAMCAVLVEMRRCGVLKGAGIVVCGGTVKVLMHGIDRIGILSSIAGTAKLRSVMDRFDDTTAPATVVQGKAYKLAADEGTALWFTNALVMVKAGGPETKQRLTIVEILHPAGYAPPMHRHLVEDESFYIISGSALFESDGERFTVQKGDFVFLPQGSTHTFLAGPEEPFRSLVITVPAGFETFAAEADISRC